MCVCVEGVGGVSGFLEVQKSGGVSNFLKNSTKSGGGVFSMCVGTMRMVLFSLHFFLDVYSYCDDWSIWWGR